MYKRKQNAIIFIIGDAATDFTSVGCSLILYFLSFNHFAKTVRNGGVTVSTGMMKHDKRAEIAASLKTAARLKLNAKKNFTVSFNKSLQVAA